MEKQRGFTTVELESVFVILLGVLAAGGWIANIIKLIGLLDGAVTAWVIARGIGVIAAPLGAILGFF